MIGYTVARHFRESRCIHRDGLPLGISLGTLVRIQVLCIYIVRSFIFGVVEVYSQRGFLVYIHYPSLSRPLLLHDFHPGLPLT